MATFLTIWIALNMLIKLICACKAIYIDHIPLYALDVCSIYSNEPMWTYQFTCMERDTDGFFVHKWQNNNCSGDVTGGGILTAGENEDKLYVECDDSTCDYVIMNDSDYYKDLYKEKVYVVGECYVFNNSWCSAFCTNTTFGLMCFDNELCESDPLIINYGMTPDGGLTKGNYQISECTNPESRLSIKTVAPQDQIIQDHEWMIVGITFISLFVITFIASIIIILLIYRNKYKKDGYRKTTALDADNEVINQK
eukprot:223716_1